MKRYMVLAGHAYYPSGFDDYLGMYDTIEEAKEAGKAVTVIVGWGAKDWYEVFDLEEEKVVYPEDSNV